MSGGAELRIPARSATRIFPRDPLDVQTDEGSVLLSEERERCKNTIDPGTECVPTAEEYISTQRSGKVWSKGVFCIYGDCDPINAGSATNGSTCVPWQKMIPSRNQSSEVWQKESPKGLPA